MGKEKRMDKPNDNLAKRQAAFAGDVIHEFHELPGRYIGSCANEYPDSKISVPKVDSAYVVEIRGSKYIINREDESGPLGEEVFEKINRYRRLLEYGLEMPVIQVITTPRLVEESLITVAISPTMYEDIIVISYPTLGGSERLSTIRKKINDEKVLSSVEAMNLVMIPRMFTSGNAEILEDVCALLDRAIVEDEFFKYELVLEMKCMIHKYAKTLDDIRRLEEVIGLQKACIAMQQHDQSLIDKGRKQGIELGIEQGIEQGIERGIVQGAFDMALRFKKAFGLEKAIEVSGFSREELENEKINR